MSEGILGVTAPYVRQLSGRQRQAAGYIKVGATITDGVGASMLVNHGVICSDSIAALGFANTAREAACAAMASMSYGLAEKLDSAASQYDRTDSQGAGMLGSQMHPR
ncbi:ESX-1 secretion-associated protein [Mycobacterium syngnathidarum]|uniref:ESX-1 secretion-associated protein n=1 Tax=Mycobacterium syngnathidarum TaxID=1908205 RepID=A0A1S1JPX1_9MYCO|nr:ESX-1 secretion-associated protein [Mycobacterium syngnathidarum]OHT90680.1 hypothetical protein BKG61_27200 [Mycobacterium syngnathidarum]